MKTELGQRLEQLAQDAVGDVSLHHPGLQQRTQGTGQRETRLPLAFAMATVVVAVLGVTWWVQRDTVTELRTTTSIESLAIPSILLEDPTPLDELSPSLQQAFEMRDVRGPLADLNPENALATFDGVHVVQRDGVVIAVGLDRSGRTLCVAHQFVGEEGTSSGCSSVADFAANGVSWSGRSFGGEEYTVVFVNDGVVAVEMGEASAPVERNIALFDTAVFDVLVARLEDGSAKNLASIPDTSAIAELTVDGNTTTDVATAGCSVVDDDYIAEAAFTGNGTLLLATVTPAGVRIGGNLDGQQIDIVVTTATVELTQVDTTLIATASWNTAESSGSLTINCGENLIDLSSIR